MSAPRELADSFHVKWLSAHPFTASAFGIGGYEDRVPDASEAGDESWRSIVDDVLVEARRLEGSEQSDADAITLGCLIGYARQELDELDCAASEFVVTAMPYMGPAQFFAVAARTVLADAHAAEDYLTRLGLSGAWIDEQVERLRIGAAKGRLPVAPLVEQAISWAEGVLDAAVPDAVAAPQPPSGWDREAAWREQRDTLATDVVQPAMHRWVELLRELLPEARTAERAGLVHLPGGDADYERAIRSHTTLPLTAEQLHLTGLEEIESLERRAVELGAVLGLSDLAAVHAALRASAGVTSPEVAMEAARQGDPSCRATSGGDPPEPLP